MSVRFCQTLNPVLVPGDSSSLTPEDDQEAEDYFQGLSDDTSEDDGAD